MKKPLTVLGVLLVVSTLAACSTEPLTRQDASGVNGTCPDFASVLYRGSSYCVGYGV